MKRLVLFVWLMAMAPVCHAALDWFGDLPSTNAIDGDTNSFLVVLGNHSNSPIRKVSSRNFTGIESFYNVRAFGAKGDGTTDDTVAISNAIVVAMGSGSQRAVSATVYFPPGVYRVAGSPIGDNAENSQLLIPYKGTGTSISNWSGLRFRGPEPAPYTGGSSSSGRHPTNGAVILTTLTNASANVISSEKLTNSGWNCTMVGVENLTFQVQGDFRGTVLNFSNMVCTRIIAVSMHQTNAGSNLTYPENSTGIDFPHAALGGEQYMERVQVEGFANGVKLSEHHYVNQLMVTFCKTGIVHKAGNHANVLDKVYTTGCNYSIAVIGQSVMLYSTINIERLSATPWTNINDVADPSNQGRGMINWRVFDNADATKHHNLNLQAGGEQNLRFCEIQWEPLVSESIDQTSTVANRGIILRYTDNSARGGMISVQKARGTTFARTAAQSGDPSYFGAGFYDAAATPAPQTPVYWGGIMDAAAGSGTTPAGFFINTGTNFTVSAERLRIESGGHVGIGTNNPNSVLHIHGSSTNVLHIQASGVNTPATPGSVLHWIPIQFNGTNGFIPFYQ